MPAQITGNSTAASVAPVKLRAGISTVVPIVGITRVIPVSEVAYILLAVGAYLDTTGRFKYTTDVVSTADVTAFSTSKVADPDYFSVPDAYALDTGKGLADTAPVTDSVVTVLIFIRNFADTATPADAKSLLIAPAYSDSVSTTETKVFSISKALADSFALNDLSDVAGPTWDFSDYTNNAVSTSDSTVITQDKGYTDSLSTADSGTLISQGYCDLTYFAGDYVGYNFTF
jgi:hypothetical protein